MIGFSYKEIPESLKLDIKSIREERANMLSHGFGLISFLIAVPFLLISTYQSGIAEYFVGSVLFSVSLLMVYASSTIYHATYHANLRKKFRVWDHISIYFLIAGSYSPFVLTHLKTVSGWSIFIVLWTMVLVGSIVKLTLGTQYKVISTFAYLIMGWLALFIIKPLYIELPGISFYCILIGGLFYTVGAYFYLRKKMKFNHLIWHLFVLGGSTSHFTAVWLCV